MEYVLFKPSFQKCRETILDLRISVALEDASPQLTREFAPQVSWSEAYYFLGA